MPASVSSETETLRPTLHEAMSANLLAWIAIMGASMMFSTAPIEMQLLGALLGAVIAAAVTGLGMMLVNWLVGRRIRRAWARWLVFALPSALLLVGGVFLPDPSPHPQQQSPTVSPDDQTVVEVDVREGVWRFRFTDERTGETQIEMTDMLGQFNVYWAWDEANRLWVRNSDDGRFHYWQREDDQWTRDRWKRDAASQDDTGDGLAPPEALMREQARGER